MAMNAGYFSKSIYDKSTYPEHVEESTSPYAYIMDTNKIHNCKGCLTPFGPSSSYFGAGVSTPKGDVIAASQEYIDIDSIMSNRNVPLSKSRNGKFNPVDITKIKTQNVNNCSKTINRQHSRMTDPAMFYRGMPINRFYDLNRDPQENIFYDWAINTSLDEKDNFVPELPIPMTGVTMISSKNNDKWKPCAVNLCKKK